MDLIGILLLLVVILPAGVVGIVEDVLGKLRGLHTEDGQEGIDGIVLHLLVGGLDEQRGVQSLLGLGHDGGHRLLVGVGHGGQLHREGQQGDMGLVFGGHTRGGDGLGDARGQLGGGDLSLGQGGGGGIHPLTHKERLEGVDGSAQILYGIRGTLEQSLRQGIVGVVLGHGLVDALDAGDDGLLHGGLLLDGAQLDEQALQLLDGGLLGLLLHIGGLDLLDEILQSLGLPGGDGEVILHHGRRSRGFFGGDEGRGRQGQSRHHRDQHEKPGADALNPLPRGLPKDPIGVLPLEGRHGARVLAEGQHGLGLFPQREVLVHPPCDAPLGGQEDEEHDHKANGGYRSSVETVSDKVRLGRRQLVGEPQRRYRKQPQGQAEQGRSDHCPDAELTLEF